MANPQKENGHTDIANEIVEVLARINLGSYESRTLWALWRKTWGWHKKEDKISLTQFQKLTGLERRNQHKALKTLIEKNIIARNTDSYIVSYSFQKDYTLWKVVSKQTPVNDASSSVHLNTTLVSKQTPKLVFKHTPTKEKKEIIQKKAAGSASACPSSQALPALEEAELEDLKKLYDTKSKLEEHLKARGFQEESIASIIKQHFSNLK